MNYFDVVIIIPLIWGAYKGFKKGFIIEMASLIALGLGIYGGMKFSSIAAVYLTQMFDISTKIMPLLSFAVTFIAIVVVVFTLAKMLQKVITMVALGIVNRIAGALFGVLKFSLIISVVLSLINSINEQVEFIDPIMKNSSILYTPISKVAALIIPEIKDFDIDGVVDKATKSITNS